MEKTEYTEKIGNTVVLLAYAEEWIKLSQTSIESLAHLSCMHEEADTRIILHSAPASREGFQEVLLISEDTDVMILALAFASKIKGTKNRSRHNSNQ